MLPADHARKKATNKNTQLLSVVAVALLLAIPSCNTNTNDVSDPAAPVVEKMCFEPGDPARGCSPPILLFPEPGEKLEPGMDLLIAWLIDNCHGYCGEPYVKVEATYHKGPAVIYRQVVEVPMSANVTHFTIPNLPDVVPGYPERVCDLVCFWVTVYDELGPVYDPFPFVIGPITLPWAPPPPRIPQELVEP